MLSGMSHPQRATASAGTLARKAQQNSPDASCRSFSSCASLSRVAQSEHQLSACWAISLWKARNSKYGQHLWSTSMCSMAAILPRLFVQFPTLGARGGRSTFAPIPRWLAARSHLLPGQGARGPAYSISWIPLLGLCGATGSARAGVAAFGSVLSCACACAFAPLGGGSTKNR